MVQPWPKPGWSTTCPPLVAVAISGSPKGGQRGRSRAQSSWPAPTPGSAAGRDDAHGQARTQSTWSAVDLGNNGRSIH
jgi:hypothetical protein